MKMSIVLSRFRQSSVLLSLGLFLSGAAEPAAGGGMSPTVMLAAGAGAVVPLGGGIVPAVIMNKKKQAGDTPAKRPAAAPGAKQAPLAPPR
ncbi:MAG: hypothetical protein H7338_11220, partial [Candidatus Sericytochromatia bacterium]|nr:hypothetical protein [Candidatus Sericytochromatia bacterium]